MVTNFNELTQSQVMSNPSLQKLVYEEIGKASRYKQHLRHLIGVENIDEKGKWKEGKKEGEWFLYFEGGQLSYKSNWKNGKRYCGEEDGLEVQDIKEWHIGGKRRYAVDLVHDAIKNYKEKKDD